jgi:hypothetical protein
VIEIVVGFIVHHIVREAIGLRDLMEKK